MAVRFVSPFKQQAPRQKVSLDSPLGHQWCPVLAEACVWVTARLLAGLGGCCWLDARFSGHFHFGGSTKWDVSGMSLVWALEGSFFFFFSVACSELLLSSAERAFALRSVC